MLRLIQGGLTAIDADARATRIRLDRGESVSLNEALHCLLCERDEAEADGRRRDVEAEAAQIGRLIDLDAVGVVRVVLVGGRYQPSDDESVNT